MYVDDLGKVNINQGFDCLEVEFYSKMKVFVFVLKIIDSMFCIKIDFELKQQFFFYIKFNDV